MIYVVIAFLWVSICLYLITGGADFGAGIIELFSRKSYRDKTKKIMSKSIAPIWEANHMWLIIAVVILFVGFPTIYTTVSTYLHIPLVLMLVGIIARGTAFTFRNYDAVEDSWQKLYTQIFYYSSLLTPFFLGIIAAATISGSIDTEAKDFLSLYIFSWFNLFGACVGFFTVSLCAYLASLFSLHEARYSDALPIMIRKTRQTALYVVVTGILVFLSAHYSDIPLLHWIFSKALGIIAITLATVSLLFTNESIKKSNFLIARVLGGFQIVMILVAATYQHNPDIILFANGTSLSLFDESAAPKTIEALGWALLLGSIFILPFLFYLLFSFGAKRNKN
ncbi:cytochrome d ubiquinol oxidase subunit II [Epilithonimonas xixisoli]|uniref:Cytochrome bd-I ubiquinol oxidase subunit 2 apoprotein n=1 Tax=Epilithonimonas xixisoli TaxID=1476462 RepID=A0A4V3H2L7_9FLAO|nr:cytochrome d ubiquinol oxidase subunit II [Epilithonimonas xixisoli]TDX84616.1 cytochrome bd-I ubiquinol oxidase subunit 2 apoprotein [Epilithonimonas xixisoli]